MPRIVLKDLATEKAQSVPETDTTLGRDPACGFVIEGPTSKVVSGRHARIFYQDNAWWIEDTSRNGTVLDDERLQAGQRHAIKVGQVIGLGESGPRLRIMALDSRKVAETVMEFPDLDAPAPSTTAPRRTEPVSSDVAAGGPAPAQAAEPRAAPTRQPETIRAQVKIEESTEPMSPSPDWLVHVVLRVTNTNQRFDVKAMVVKLGRSAESNVQIPAEQGASVSRNHAEIAIQDGGVVIRDVGSRNGTFVNGKRLEAPQPAAKSDLIMLGSGGPTFAIEDLHIVKGEGPSPGGGGGVDTTPAEAKPGAANLSAEPKTDPSPKARGIVAKAMGPAARLARRSFSGAGRTAFFKDVLEDMSQKSARRVRIVVWASVGTTVLVAATLLAITQWRVTASENRMMEERRLFEARADSIRIAATAEATRLRTAFDSARASSAPRVVVDSLREALADAARRTGVLEQALARARQSLDQQLATGDSAQHRAEVDIDRLRAEVGKAQSVGGSRVALDSLRRALRDAEGRAAEVSSHIRAVRAVDLAHVAQLNQNAVGLVTMFADTSGAEGSGFAITPSGYFVTNRHVVTTDSGKLADSVFVTMADQRYVSWSRADVVAIGQGEVDIAVLKIRDYRGPYIKRVDWSTVNAKQGEPAALIGFPRGTMVALDSSDIVRTSMSAGIFSKITPNRIQADLFSQGGSSGSPIFNASGEVVAVHFAGLSGVTGLGFAVPVSRVVFLLPSDAKNELGLR
jgi:pSer/pThr/pTyr-binding forkhead associated (FHA) protein/S1-C subfamily serine protease